MSFWKRKKLVLDASPLTFQDVKFADETFSNRIALALVSKNALAKPLPMFYLTRVPRPRVPLLALLGQICGLVDTLNTQLLAAHTRRLTVRHVKRMLWFLLMTPVVVVVTMLPVLGLFGLVARTRIIDIEADWALPVIVTAVLPILFLEFVLLSIAIRLAGRLTDRHYADSLCVTSVLILNIELRREHVLEFPDRRLGIVRRLRELQEATQLLVLQYGAVYPEAQRRLSRHFGALVQYLREREHWASVPTETTLEDLRRDVAELTTMYVSGRYGAFTWSRSQLQEAQPRSGRSVWRIAARGLGYVAPLALMLYVLITPNVLRSREIPATAVAALFMAWFLLSLDNLLGLGVVANLVALAKGIKELK
ncbi:MAG TPA: hypothetical protein VJT67_10470 [Longimicrobiaceae bacterium]|nr:hypothetical protein [Longimicrobiaceae bacterium]